MTDAARVTAFYDAIDAFQRTHRLPGLQHAQLRGLLAEHLARSVPAMDQTALAPMFEGFARLLSTSSRDWGQYAPDAWLWAVICGWDCEETEHDGTCVHGAMEEMQERHGWDDATVAKVRRYRAAVRAITEGAAVLSTPVDQTAEENEEEKLAKARRMAKAFSAPPVAPPNWAATTEWPGRHKRPGDRRVHATARFVVNNKQRIWTACKEHVGQGGTPLNHMPVDCRACQRAIAAGARQDGANR
jgi:hypothetical protein